MSNELLLIGSLILIYAIVVGAYRFLGLPGLYGWTVFATVTANIEVLILVNAFGMEQTLGNILFASTFLVTDIISELEGKDKAQKAVHIGIATSFLFAVVSQLWLLYIPNGNDWAFPHIQAIFSNTPRLILVSFVVYAAVQKFDVWLYHKIWKFTEKRCGDSKRFLWLRNNASTLISQLLNAILFNVGAFGSLYDSKTLINIVLSSYVVFIFTSLADTPAIYLARHFAKKS